MIKDKLAITPHRMYAMLSAVAMLEGQSRDTVIVLAQPPEIVDNKDTAVLVYRYLLRCGLIIADGSPQQQKTYLSDSGRQVKDWDSFRSHMQDLLLGKTEESSENFLLNQFTSWYAVQDDQVMVFSKLDLEERFHKDLYPVLSERVLAEEPGISAWRTWAEFLGFGWRMKFSQRDEMRIVPDATLRLISRLPDLLPAANDGVSFNAFMNHLSRRCPELDGGILFEHCWQASRGNEVRGNRLSLMLSTALRTLHNLREIELVNRLDAAETWTLFPAQSHIGRVSHIRRKAAA